MDSIWLVIEQPADDGDGASILAAFSSEADALRLQTMLTTAEAANLYPYATGEIEVVRVNIDQFVNVLARGLLYQTVAPLPERMSAAEWFQKDWAGAGLISLHRYGYLFAKVGIVPEEGLVVDEGDGLWRRGYVWAQSPDEARAKLLALLDAGVEG